MKSFKEHVLDEDTHKGLAYHLENNIPLAENIYRYGSKEFFNTINEARRLYEEEKIDLSYADIDFLKTDIGSFGVYESEEVPLDFPMEEVELTEGEDKKNPPLNKPHRGGPKKFFVYVRKPDGGIKKVTFGDKGGAAGGGTLSVKMNDPVARKSFAARHQCHLQKDRTSAAYWSCNLPRYAKSLGLSGGGSFYW